MRPTERNDSLIRAIGNKLDSLDGLELIYEARILGETGKPEAIDVLKRILCMPMEKVRFGDEEAMTLGDHRFGPMDSHTEARTALKRIELLGRLGPSKTKRLSILISALEKSNTKESWEFEYALRLEIKAIGPNDKDVLPLLLKILERGGIRYDLREAAARAISVVGLFETGAMQDSTRRA